ncbi:MAG: peroxiredoxin [Hyphomicrobiaceae bacterium]|nr:peroxiredoxin [Hyphomicrobiaceae bacterium]
MAAILPAPGTPLPSIVLPSTAASDLDVSRWPGTSVIFVYPYTGRPGIPDPPGWDDIPGAHGSTPEARGFADLMAEFARANISVFGLSSQDRDWQLEFAIRARLPYPLLSDADFRFADALSLPRFRAGDRDFLTRLTLVADTGVIREVLYPVPDPQQHAAEVLARLVSPR